ncbi:30S ribosomal protein THX [Fulvivirga lutimaris]|uniref:30S ribosomal protein THX n=1 Tax=Fulvivirga lutimaris TaxID=1819566 RepID=UPI0012BD5049|nr:30S ribosomal protein THX [Fulvivirga lutimaris]MTI38955.1 30S ribosomal protein THX [Fulvivirga lutimaris]
MGKGDIKTRRGKIAKGTFGVTRKRSGNKKSSVTVTEPKAKPKKKPAAKKTKA